jgi:NADH pyrophosphatase NudC (nudix superfamily)
MADSEATGWKLYVGAAVNYLRLGLRTEVYNGPFSRAPRKKRKIRSILKSATGASHQRKQAAEAVAVVSACYSVPICRECGKRTQYNVGNMEYKCTAWCAQKATMDSFDLKRLAIRRKV